MKKFSKITIFFFILCALCFVAAHSANAQSFSLSPATATKTVGQSFTVNLNIDAGGKAIAGADVKLTFDPSVIEVTDVAKGDFFTDEAHNIGSGTLYVAGFFAEQFKTKSTSGTIATITLKGKVADSDQLVFVCSPQTNDSNIYDSSNNDIIVCSSTTNGTYTFTGSSTEPTSAPGVATATPTPPVSGITLPTFMAIGFGCFLTILGVALLF